MSESKKYGFSCSDPTIPAEIQRWANKRFNGNFSKMVIVILIAGMEAIRQKPTEGEYPAGQ